MQSAGTRQFQATLAAPQEEHFGFFVEVVDRDPDTVSGLITTGFNELQPEK